MRTICVININSIINAIWAKSFAFAKRLRVQWLASKLIQPRQCYPGVASNVFRIITYVPTYENQSGANCGPGLPQVLLCCRSG